MLILAEYEKRIIEECQGVALGKEKEV